jgi:predicted DNA-binding protein
MSNEGKMNTRVFSLKMPEDMYMQITSLAAKEHRSSADVVREMINKGLNVEGYTQDIDMIATVVRNEVKIQTDKQADRLAKMLMKIGKVSAGEYYLLIKYLLAGGHSNYATVNQLSGEAQKLGIKYMQLKDIGINDYLEDDDAVINDSQRL